MEKYDVIDEMFCKTCNGLYTHKIDSKTKKGECFVCKNINSDYNDCLYRFRLGCPKCDTANLYFEFTIDQCYNYAIVYAYCNTCDEEREEEELIRWNTEI